MTSDDMTLVREFAAGNSEPAFTALVERHLGLIYSAALRQVGDDHLAEEITQAVFIILASKAAALGPKTILSAWLYRTTRYAAADALKAQRRRAAREQEAYMQSTLNEPSADDAWTQLAPLLDDALNELGETDRAALVLRYFENKSAREMAGVMRMEEEAVQKRVTRALDKLRARLMKRGVTLTATVIAGAVAANSVQAAPVGLAVKLSVITAKGVATTIPITTIVKGALNIMAWTKVKTVIGVGILLVAGVGTLAVKSNYFPSEPSYQGRRLSEWLVDINYDQPQEKQNKAGEAVRQMGAKTLPFLLADLANQQAKDNRYSQATRAFDALGPIGKPAIPKLTKLLEQNPGYVPGALAGIGRDALPVLLNALTNGSFFVRDNTAAYLGNAIYSGKITSDEASAAFPVAIDNLQYDSTNALFRDNTRWRAASLLDALKMEPDISVPALIKGMEDLNFTVAATCAQALGSFGDRAKSAIPVLTAASGSTNQQLSWAASRSLEMIERKR